MGIKLFGKQKKRIPLGIVVFLMVFLFIYLPANADTEEKTEDLPDIPEDYCGYIPDEMPAAPLRDSGTDDVPLLRASDIPNYYDSREHGVVTSVKNQGSYATCWSFASMAALESSLLSQNKAVNPDLSEMHYIRYAYFNISDPLDGTVNDTITFSGSDYMGQGGNVAVYYHELANWKGAVTEETTPYTEENIHASFTPSKEDAFSKDLIHLQQCYKISKNDTDGIKRAVMEYGAVTSALYYNSSYMNTSKAAYYSGNGTTEISNHAVAIVGWDDNYSKSNFKVTPSRDGAWLFKNSWGTGFGNNGYLWVSYDELTLAENSCVLIGESADNYDHNYQYDGAYLDSYFSVSSNTKIANTFTVKGESVQELKAVSFDLYSSDVEYNIQVYKNLSNPANPASGTSMLETPVKGKTGYAGYYTVQLPQTVQLDPGETFSVVITLIKSGNINVISEHGGKWGGTYFSTYASANESMVCFPGYTYWTDFGAQKGGNIRIKAFTDDVETEPNPFADVEKGTWKYNAAKYVYENHYMAGKGTINGKVIFSPNQTIRREEFVRVLYNAEGCPKVSILNPYPDVEDGVWYTDAVLWAREVGIAKGKGDGNFGIGSSITRQDLAKILYEYARLKGYDLSKDDSAIDEFADASMVSGYARDAVNWAVTHGIISGKGVNGAPKSEVRIDPRGKTTRAECASMIKKLFEQYNP